MKISIEISIFSSHNLLFHQILVVNLEQFKRSNVNDMVGLGNASLESIRTIVFFDYTDQNIINNFKKISNINQSHARHAEKTRKINGTNRLSSENTMHQVMGVTNQLVDNECVYDHVQAFASATDVRLKE